MLFFRCFYGPLYTFSKERSRIIVNVYITDSEWYKEAEYIKPGEDVTSVYYSCKNIDECLQNLDNCDRDHGDCKDTDGLKGDNTEG